MRQDLVIDCPAVDTALAKVVADEWGVWLNSLCAYPEDGVEIVNREHCINIIKALQELLETHDWEEE